MKSARLFICLFSFFIVHFALPFAFAGDPVEAIQYTYHNLTDLEAQFTQRTFVEALGKEVANSGTLYLKKPGMLRLEYRGNPQRHYISDGKKLWVYTPGDNQYQTYQVGGKTIPRDALTFLNGFGEIDRTFEVMPYEPSRREKGHWYVGLRPRKPAGYTKLDCVFDSRFLLVGLTIHNASGNKTRYSFTGVRMNPGVSAEKFRFTPPAGAHEVNIEK